MNLGVSDPSFPGMDGYREYIGLFKVRKCNKLCRVILGLRRDHIGVI